MVPVFGSGRVVVQPIDVDDLARCLAELMGRERLGGELLELGGPETLSFEALLRRAHRALRGRDARVVHLPLGPIHGLLRAVEGPLRPVLPVTAGQLTAFRFDSDAAPNALAAAREGEMLGVDAMLARYTAR